MSFANGALQFLHRMVWVDYSIAGVLAVCSLLGLARGARRETLALGKWLAGSLIAWFFAEDFSRLLTASVAHATLRMAAAFGGMIFLTLLLSSLIWFLMTFGRKKAPPSLFNYLAGVPVALLRGLLLVILLTALAGLTSLPKHSWWHESQTLPYFQAGIVWFKNRFPSGFSGHLHYR